MKKNQSELALLKLENEHLKRIIKILLPEPIERIVIKKHRIKHNCNKCMVNVFNHGNHMN